MDDDWKPLLRAVLMSSKEGVTAHRVTADYRGITNEPLPFRRLGFDNLHDFMKSIPDIVRIGRHKDTGDTCYFAVADETTKGLQRMIACQKGKKKRGKPVGYNMSRRPFVKKGGAPYRPSFNKFGPRTPQQKRPAYNQVASSSHSPEQKRPPLRQPAQVKRSPLFERTIKQVTSSPKFGDNFEVPPRFQKQYNSPEDESRVVKTGVTSLSSETSALSYKALLHNALQKFNEKPVYETTMTREGFVSIVTARERVFGSTDFCNTKSDAEHSAAQTACMSLGIRPEPKKGKHRAVEKNNNDFEDGSHSFDELGVKERVREILSRRTNGLWESRLIVEYEEKYSEKPPSHLARLIEEWPEVVRIEVVPNTDRRILYPVQSLRVDVSRAGGDHARTVQVIKSMENIKIEDPVLPPVGTKLTGFISHPIDPLHFYVQMADSSINEIMQEVEKDYGGRSRPSIVKEPIPGMFCVAQFSEDKGWYRAQIHSVRKNIQGQTEVEIYYVDFGNSEVRSAGEVCEISSRISRHPHQAFRCQLHNVRPVDGAHWSSEAISQFKKCTNNKELTISVENVLAKTLVCTIFDSKKPTLSLNDYLVKRGLARHAEGGGVTSLAPTQGYPETLAFPQEVFWDVYVSYIRNTNYLVFRLVGSEYSDKLEALEEAMANYYSKKPNPPQLSVKENGLYAACSEDSWFRVQVQAVEGEQVDCLFLDHGDSEVLSDSQLRALEPQFNQLPYQAISCCLAGLEQFEDNDQVTEKLFEMALGKTYVAEVLERGEKCTVNFFDTCGETDVNINEALGTMIADEELAPTLPPVGSTVEGYVSYVSARGTVFFQVLGPGLQRLDEFMEDIAQHYSKKTSAQEFISNPIVGQICVAKYTEDNFWYRAEVLKVLPQRKVRVQYVDYGNSEVVLCSSLREPTKANKHLATLPFQAVECELVNLPPPGRWTEDAVARLSYFMPMDAVRILKVHKLASRDSLPQVELLLTDVDQNEVSINDLLVQEPDVFLPPEIRLQKKRLSDSGLDKKLAQISLSNPETPQLLPDSTRSADATSEGGDSPVGGGAPVSQQGQSPGEVADASLAKAANTPPTSEPDSVNVTFNMADIPRDYKSCAALSQPPKVDVPCIGDYMDLHVPWSCDPDSFTVIPYNTMKDLVELMEFMRIFYSNSADFVQIPTVNSGELYAGYQELSWYRVVIKNILPDSQMSVQFMDYGDFGIVSLDELQPLPAVFRQLPFQALKASMAGVQPVSASGWSSKAIHRFSELVNEKSLVGLICSHDLASGVIGVRLVDTSDDEVDICIEDILIKEGLAVSTVV